MQYTYKFLREILWALILDHYNSVAEFEASCVVDRQNRASLFEACGVLRWVESDRSTAQSDTIMNKEPIYL